MTESRELIPDTAGEGRCEPAMSGEAVLSRKKAKKARKVVQKIKLTPGSVDVRVQHTNDDSVVSKRSAVAMNYLNDPFLRHFVKKPTRRAPLINRGYYLRMLAMTDVVTQAINHLCESSSAECPVQVLSLGAGYDTFAFRSLLPREMERHRNDKNATRANCASLDATVSSRLQFFDVDFPAVMQSKAALMAAATKGSFDDLENLVLQPSDEIHPVQSAQYNAVGVDLREAQRVLLERLSETAVTTGFSPHHPTVVYAECVMQYMPPDAARALIAFFASTFSNAIFIAYDQLQPADSFGKVMCDSLKHKNSPLLGIAAAPNGVSMAQRAYNAGMASVFFANFHDLCRYHIGPAEEQRLKSLEAFDELEEWAEMCEHYGITLAFTTTEKTALTSGASLPAGSAEANRNGVFGNPAFRDPLTLTTSALVPKEECGDQISPTIAALRQPWPSSRFGFEGWGNGDVFAEAHPTDPNEVIIVSFGGFCVSGDVNKRVNAVYAHGLRAGEMKVVVTTGDCSPSSEIPPSLIFHSISRLAAFTYVVFGGRTNPDTAFDDTYLLHVVPQRSVGGESTVVAQWHLLKPNCHASADGVDSSRASCPSPRFRHSAVALPGETPSLFVCCGCNASTHFGDAWIGKIDLHEHTVTWEEFVLTGQYLPPLLSASLTLLPSDSHTDRRLLLTGGLEASGHCNHEARLINVGDRTIEALSARLGNHSLLKVTRFSHTVTPVTVDGRQHLLVLGGCAADEKVRCLRSMAVLVDATLSEPPVEVVLPAACPTALARHSVVTVARGVVAVVGGGYTCFSFGTFTSRPFLLSLGNDCERHPSWAAPAAGHAASHAGTLKDGCNDAMNAGKPSGMYPTFSLLSLPRTAIEEHDYSPVAFLKAAKAATKPVVFRRVDLGPCLRKWANPEYLKQAEKDAVVSVHVANAKDSHFLDFVRKNFTFRHVPFPELVEHIQESMKAVKNGEVKTPQNRETWYFRSVAANMKTQRANLWSDFKTLGGDFELPDGAKDYIAPRLHQSCLRLNAAPLQLWTHYDSFDNILCHIVGRKRVVLFPPSEFGNLYTHGSSSPVLDLDHPDLQQYPRFIDACKRAHEVILEPGDVLYFPANWFHHITTLMDAPGDTYSVSVNLFFDHFEKSVYDQKDLYGNKDIPAVVELREKIGHLVREAVASQRIHHQTDEVNEQELPKAYAQFALRQALQDLETFAEELSFESGMLSLS